MKPKKYNPAFLCDDDLERSFVVRHHELDTIVRSVRDDRGVNNQHLLVIAPRGFGKSTLVLRAALAIRRDPTLAETWIPVIFAEESYEISTLGEFWLEALMHLADSTADAGLKAAWTTLHKERDEERLRARARGALLDYADGRHGRLLFIVENLDVLLDEQMDRGEGWALRDTLLHERRVLLLGTAVHRFDGVDQPDAPMFELFRRVEMAPLDARECDAIWALVTGERIGTRRAKAVKILCGGNPRLVVVLASFSRGRGLHDLLSELDDLIDDNTEYFRQNIEALEGNMRRVFLAVAELWQPSLARAIAEAARLEVNETSACLHRLVRQGRVTIARSAGKNHYYQVTERLYNIYYLMRRRHGAASRVRALVDFIQSLFGPDEQPGVMGAIAAEACGRESGAREEHLHLIGQLLNAKERKPEYLAQLAEQIPTELFKAADLPTETRAALMQPEVLVARLKNAGGEALLDEAAQALDALRKDLQTKATGRVRQRRLEQGLGLAAAVIGHEDATIVQLLNAALMVAEAMEPSDRPRADLLVRVAGRLSGVESIATLAAAVLTSQRRVSEALTLLEQAHAAEPEHRRVALALARTLLMMGNREAWERAVEVLSANCEPSHLNAEVLDRLCFGLCKLGRTRSATQLFHDALGRMSASSLSNPEFVRSVAHTGYELAARAPMRTDAIDLVRQVVELVPESAAAWYYQAYFQLRNGERLAALHSVGRSIDLDGTASRAWQLRARCLLQGGEQRQAHAAVRKAVQLAPEDVQAWTTYVQVALAGTNDDMATLVARALNALPGPEHGRHDLAYTLFRGGPATLWPLALSTLEAVSHDRYLCPLLHDLLGAVRGADAALAYLRRVMSGGDWRDGSTSSIQHASMRVAAAGLAREMAEILTNSSVCERMEPMIVALRRRDGQLVDSPQEVSEVADEVNRRIDALRETGDIWRVDIGELTLSDERDQGDEASAEVDASSA